MKIEINLFIHLQEIIKIRYFIQFQLLQDIFLTIFAAILADVGPIPASIDPMRVTVSFNHSVVGSVQLPKVNSKPFGTTSIDISATFQISDKKAFNSFARALIREQEVAWHLSGVATIKVFGFLPVGTVNFEKDVKISGMNQPERCEMIFYYRSG